MKLNWQNLLISIGILISRSHCLTQFSLKITKYHTYSYRRLDGKCCGESRISSQGTCYRPCNQKFRICLEYYQAQVSLTDPKPYSGPCAFGMKDTTIWGKSDLKFDKTYLTSDVIIIRSPWPGSIALIIEAHDTEESGPFHRLVIDRVVYRNILKPSLEKKSSEKWQDVVLLNGPSVYQFSISLTCHGDYYGESCDRYCKNNSGHYKCDKNGDKVCNYGWMGTDCNTTICKAGCHRVHGFCPQPGECICREGWKGPFCDECIKYPGCKHGTCIDSPWTCYCENNWGGQFCDQSLNYCAENNPCKNGGICENQASPSKPYICVCPSGLSGENCEIDPCVPNPCKKGTCLKSKDGFYCQCFPGWTGLVCDHDSSICDVNSCQNGGRCEKDEIGNNRCVCLPGFQGSECHIAAPCDKSQCKHSSDCQIQSTSFGDYKCNCRDGWSGKFCDQEINECEKNPCKNNGVCKDYINMYTCECKPGFKGLNCEVNVACQVQHCKNGGVCQETDFGYSCKCKKGYSGKNCEIYKTGCSPNPCLNGAYCYTVEQDFFCQCKSDFWGKQCEHPRPYCGKESCENAYDACAMPQMINSSGIKQNVCGKYGSCVSQEKQNFTCRCMTGFEGQFCQININDCKSDSCENGGICIDGINDFECICNNGFHGRRCEQKMDFCSRNPCLNGGTCKETSTQLYNDFICHCKGGWGGRLCHLPNNMVCDHNSCLNGGTCTTTYSINGFKCHCNEGFLGTVCQFRHKLSQPCSINIHCKNGGACINVGYNNFTCHCPPGFEGRQCEVSINECHPNPCFNGGVCEDLINSYRCHCTKGFYGTNCQLNFDECASYPCAYGSVCVDRIDGYECRCPQGRTGMICDQVINNVSPQPPSCVFHNRIFDSGEVWTYNCQDCSCTQGKVNCENIACGIWNCLKAIGSNDPYACKSDEICHAYPFDANRCFVPPCVGKALCIKRDSQAPQITVTWPGETSLDCRPNAIQKNNYCAQILLTFIKSNLQIGITIDDICEALKTLPSVRNFQDRSIGTSLGITCDVSERNPSIIIVAIYSPSEEKFRSKSSQPLRPFTHFLSDDIANNLVEVVRNSTIFAGLTDIRVETLLLNTDSTDKTSLMRYMLVPIIVFGLIIVIIVFWYHRRKTKEIREKFSNSSKINNNNIQGPSLNPLRSQYPNLRPGIPNKHLTEQQSFYGPKMTTQGSRFAWARLQHPFQT